MVRHYSSELLQTQKSSPSNFYHQKEKFKLEQIDKNKTVLLFDSKTLWILEYETIDSKYPQQISRTKSKDAIPKIRQLVDYTFLKSNFTISKNKTFNETMELQFKPSNKSNQLNIFDLTVGIRSNRLSFIMYRDEMDNKIKYEIKSSECHRNSPKGFFSFEPKDENTVIEL
jgi:outer membrane lipoprotein-sorting protein